MNKDNLSYVFTVIFCVVWHFELFEADHPLLKSYKGWFCGESLKPSSSEPFALYCHLRWTVSNVPHLPNK